MPHRPHTARTTSHGFTLIELLVTVSVVGVLTAVLLPALVSARQAGMRTVGASNARQLALANTAYAQDHDGRYAPAAKAIATANLHRWHGTRASTGEPFDPAQGELTQYLDTPDVSTHVRACPRFAPVLDTLRASGAGFENGAGGYGYNAAFVGAVREPAPGGTWRVLRDDVGSRASRFRRPSHTLMFADAAFAAGTGAGGEWGPVTEYAFAEPDVWPQFQGGFSPDPSIHFRHNGLANIAWLDGHVSQEARARTAWSGLYPQDPKPAMLGWFDDQPDNRSFDYD